MPPNHRVIAARAAGSSSLQIARSAERAQPSKQPKPPEKLFNPMHLKNNMGVVFFIRIYTTIVAGAVAGILGVTGLNGFYVYLGSQALCTLPILAMARGNIMEYFTASTQALLDNVFGSTALMSYILLWMIFYNLGHVFT